MKGFIAIRGRSSGTDSPIIRINKCKFVQCGGINVTSGAYLFIGEGCIDNYGKVSITSNEVKEFAQLSEQIAVIRIDPSTLEYPPLDQPLAINLEQTSIFYPTISFIIFNSVSPILESCKKAMISIIINWETIQAIHPVIFYTTNPSFLGQIAKSSTGEVKAYSLELMLLIVEHEVSKVQKE
ncbi:MAG: hypothetical protein EZS28_043137, partial [Streblomastix strix]